MVLTVGSFAMEAREPGQVRKKAAVSEMFHVPRGNLTRANSIRSAWISRSITGARYILFFLGKHFEFEIYFELKCFFCIWKEFVKTNRMLIRVN